MSRRIGVAQLSFWFVHAEEFCRLALETPEVDLVAVWDSDAERGRDRAAKLGVPFEPDLDQLLAREDLDAVSLCAEPFRQPELAEAAAQAGKHMLIEKPLAEDLDGAARIVRAVERHGVQAMPAYNLRFHPVSRHLKDLVAGGELGRIARVRRLHGHSLAFERGDFRGSSIRRVMGWGDPRREHRTSLLFAGSHSALWYQWMFGAPVSVQCAVSSVTEEWPVEDNAVALLRYEDGMIGIIETSETMLAQETVAEIYGTDGVAIQLRGNLPSTRVWNVDWTPLMVFRRETEEWEFPALPPEFLRHEPEHSSVGQFFQALRSGSQVPTTVYDGYDSIAILVAAEEAAARRQEVEVVTWDREGARA